MRNIRLGFLIACSIAAVVAAKVPTVKLTIAGPTLLKSIDVTDPKAVSANVWEGNFIAGPATEPDTVLPRYVVSFYIAGSKGEAAKMCYVVYYVRNSQTGDGYVYLPGRGEDWYRLNRGSIIRDGLDGKWHRAERRWSDAVAAALPSL